MEKVEEEGRNTGFGDQLIATEPIKACIHVDSGMSHIASYI